MSCCPRRPSTLLNLKAALFAIEQLCLEDRGKSASRDHGLDHHHRCAAAGPCRARPWRRPGSPSVSHIGPAERWASTAGLVPKTDAALHGGDRRRRSADLHPPVTPTPAFPTSSASYDETPEEMAPHASSEFARRRLGQSSSGAAAGRRPEHVRSLPPRSCRARHLRRMSRRSPRGIAPATVRHGAPLTMSPRLQLHHGRGAHEHHRAPAASRRLDHGTMTSEAVGAASRARTRRTAARTFIDVNMDEGLHRLRAAAMTRFLNRIALGAGDRPHARPWWTARSSL